MIELAKIAGTVLSLFFSFCAIMLTLRRDLPFIKINTELENQRYRRVIYDLANENSAIMLKKIKLTHVERKFFKGKHVERDYGVVNTGDKIDFILPETIAVKGTNNKKWVHIFYLKSRVYSEYMIVTYRFNPSQTGFSVLYKQYYSRFLWLARLKAYFGSKTFYN